MSEIKHTPLPWIADVRSGCAGIYPESRKDETNGLERYHDRNIMYTNKGQQFITDQGKHWIMDEEDQENVKFIAEACNNYYKLKEQNEKMKEALEKIQNPIMYLQRQAEANWASLDGIMAVALSRDCEWLKSIAYDALKSCES